MWQKKIFQRSKNIQFYRFVYRVMYLLTFSTLDPYHKHGENRLLFGISEDFPDIPNICRSWKVLIELGKK